MNVAQLITSPEGKTLEFKRDLPSLAPVMHNKYAGQGIATVEEARDEAKVAEALQPPPINQIGRPVPILNSFGSKIRFRQAVRESEQEIYRAA